MESSRWDPFSEVGSIRNEIDRIFDSFLGRLPIRRGRDEPWIPLVDIEETEGELIVLAELPGVKKGDIKISYSGDHLTLMGERELKKEEKEKTFHQIEGSYGCFERTIPLHTEIEKEKIRASYQDGILQIFLPKTEKVKPREIAIEIK